MRFLRKCGLFGVLVWGFLAVPFFLQESEVIQVPSNSPHPHCQFYDGVLLISQGDRNGAAGTIFYLFIMNQLLYAEKHNLQPWIHLNNVSRFVYDPTVHGIGGRKVYQFPGQLKVTWEAYQDKTYSYPGKPQWVNHEPVSIAVEGSGVWNSYFQSTVFLTRNAQILPLDLTRPCTNLPILNLNTDQELVHGLHLACPYCLRSWKYGGVPPTLKLPTNYHQWWGPMRLQGSRLLQTYYHPTVTPVAEESFPPCLAIHIRHSDKANKRQRIPLKAFLPYCQAFVALGGRRIHLATDSSLVIDKIQQDWPQPIVQTIEWKPDMIRSSDTTPVFDGRASRHRTNREVLWDIQQLARCRWFLHGFSAVSEATIYTNPMLHNQSVNLEFYTYYQRHRHSAKLPDSDAPMSVEAFQLMLQSSGLK